MTFDFTALKQNYDDKQYANCFPALKEVKSLLARPHAGKLVGEDCLAGRTPAWRGLYCGGESINSRIM